MKITDKDLAWALAEMSMLRYFPSSESGEMAQEAIVGLLRRMVGTREQLHWLVRQLVDHVGEWPGPAQVRGLLCSRYRPADGIEADCALPGFTAADGEIASSRKDPPALTAGEAQKLIAGLTAEPTIEEQIAEYRERARQFCKSPATVRDCLAKIAELEAKRGKAAA